MSSYPPPTPQSITVRLKSHKTTVLLTLPPLTTIHTLKAHLLTSLDSSGPVHDASTGAPLSLPSHQDDIMLGKPAESGSGTKGFIALFVPSDSDSSDLPENTSSKWHNPYIPQEKKATLKSLGLRDGAVLAFRWAGDGVWDPVADEEFVEETEQITWGVVKPSFEDVYGVEVAGEKSGGEFEE